MVIMLIEFYGNLKSNIIIMWKYIKSFIFLEEKSSINPNSMSSLPDNRFINFARDKNKPDESEVPFKNIYEWKAYERSFKQKKQQKDYRDWYDYFNH